MPSVCETSKVSKVTVGSSVAIYPSPGTLETFETKENSGPDRTNMNRTVLRFSATKTPPVQVRTCGKLGHGSQSKSILALAATSIRSISKNVKNSLKEMIEHLLMPYTVARTLELRKKRRDLLLASTLWQIDGSHNSHNSIDFDPSAVARQPQPWKCTLQ